MLTWSIVAALVLVSFAAIHALCALVVLRWRGSHVDHLPPDFQPRVAVVLSIRGRDPSLADTVRGLLAQHYDRYEVHMVVDHRSDPAWAELSQLLQREDVCRRARLHELQSPPPHCGLKCAALVQAIRGLPPVEIVATIDADVIPHPHWLTTLIAPLADPQIGVVTGNHWFEPVQANGGSLLRSLWNAGALVPTSVFANPWAGTAAFRLEEIHRTGLLDLWERSAVDDGPVRRAIATLGKRIHFVPGLLMINREACSLQYFLRYVVRILTWSRVYEPSFWFTVAHATVNLSAWGAVALLGLLALIRRDAGATVCATAGLLLHAGGLWLAFLIVRHGVSRMVETRGDRLPRMPRAVATTTFLLTPVAFLLHGYGVLRALTTRAICWRGIWYRIAGPGAVVRTGYAPLREETPSATSSQHSI